MGGGPLQSAQLQALPLLCPSRLMHSMWGCALETASDCVKTAAPHATATYGLCATICACVCMFQVIVYIIDCEVFDKTYGLQLCRHT
jgi:hypothetical protein